MKHEEAMITLNSQGMNSTSKAVLKLKNEKGQAISETWVMRKNGVKMRVAEPWPITYNPSPEEKASELWTIEPL